ncbi:hypothetical protein SERLA73DRAFT_190684 [Serpula lacrymans var. lacrymans S7.3]|uniref:Defect at low temperature protein 1 n=2 Tax=Serpula lacrymans var. lacrymans TaxID=341189 RepID=F8QG61_SERL3|nr:uncharacterized protein SERLADRAFT_478886 [Serpula lacrymans var. lacrymans S7.9]EGN92676.1 hypothetical protein SERLA73DRAFT_190684 [Serpula lacrymans var. lacrymans S7.3]EGO19460.1 hypothetical protein SERLADRAFT_478886 [Serpula lacrymans var. lacrymans S7.9]
MLRPSSRALSWVSEGCYVILVLVTGWFFAISCVALLSQAVRTSPTRSWTDNYTAVVIGATYFIVLVASLSFCIKRRIAVRRRLQRISKAYSGIQENIPKTVHEYISQEYVRACLVSYESQPVSAIHEGWGRPGTQYSGMRFRRTLLDTISDIDSRAHLIIPSHPTLKPHSRMLHHFRFIMPLLPKDEGGITALHYYDSAISLARVSDREPTEQEFKIGLAAAEEIRQILDECRLEMMRTPGLK